VDVFDPCEWCGRACDYATSGMWGVCDTCYYEGRNEASALSEISAPPILVKKPEKIEEDYDELLEILP